MPELPDIELYLAALRPRVVGQRLQALRITSPFLLRTFEPPVESAHGQVVQDVTRVGKRIVFDLAPGPCVVVHLMIAGRFRWTDAGGAAGPAVAVRPKKPPARPGAHPAGRVGLAVFTFASGTLLLVESSPKKRAGLWVMHDLSAARTLGAGGADLEQMTPDAFEAVLRLENRTLKRVLTDPRRFDGIGNAYSDEILHAARLSPLKLTSRLTTEESRRLHSAGRTVLKTWTARLQTEHAGRFPGPGDVTAFRPDFAVHGKFGHPCPVCHTLVQRIRYAENETNYCPRCQAEGTVYADRSMSLLLKKDWPSRVEDWE